MAPFSISANTFSAIHWIRVGMGLPLLSKWTNPYCEVPPHILKSRQVYQNDI